MKLTVQQVMDATLLVSLIIREQRPMPQKGKYRLARMHAKLYPEFKLINERRDAMIKAYDYHQKVEVEDPDNAGQKKVVDGPEWQVPPDKNDEFNAAWAEIAKEEIEVAVEPIPLAYLVISDSQNGAIEANELITLGDLIAE